MRKWKGIESYQDARLINIKPSQMQLLETSDGDFVTQKKLLYIEEKINI